MYVMDNLENILSYDAICAKYNVSCSSKIYDEIIKNILLQMIKLVKEQVKYSTINPKIPDLKIENINSAAQNVLTYSIFEELSVRLVCVHWLPV